MPQHEPTLGDEKDERLNIISAMIWQGMSQAKIVNEILDKPDKYPWNLSARQLRNYYKECWDNFDKNAGSINRSAWFTVTLNRYDDDYGIAKAAGDRKEARENNTAIANLLHLDKPGYDMDWRKTLKDAGIDPQEAIGNAAEQFEAIVNGKRDVGQTE